MDPLPTPGTQSRGSLVLGVLVLGVCQAVLEEGHLPSAESRGGPGARLKSPGSLFQAPSSSSLTHCASSLTFQLHSAIGVGREHLIFIIWFREGPEALSHCMVSMETDLFGGLDVVRQWWWG